MKGKLLIVGGALSSNNREVYERFIKMAGGKKKAMIGIIPAASRSPLESGEVFKNDLINIYGLEENKIKILPIYNENNAENVLLDKSYVTREFLKSININLEEFTGIWFTGGDQRKIAQFLYYKNGEETQLLKSIKSIYKKGAVIAGTSAGAAIMSDYMITGGTSDSLEFGKEIKNFYEISKDDSSTLSIGKGLGLFTHGIIDQHFRERDRLARLIRVCTKIEDTKSGFGIDENTAISIEQSNNLIEVLGEGGLTIVDMKNSSLINENEYTEIDGIRLHYLLSGDKFNLKNNLPTYSGKNINNLKEELLTITSKPTPKNSFEAFSWLINSQSIKGGAPSITTYSLENPRGQKLFFKFALEPNSNFYFNKRNLSFSAENINFSLRYTEKN